MGQSLIVSAPCWNPTPASRLPRHDPGAPPSHVHDPRHDLAPALDPDRDRHRVGRGLPRRDRPQRRTQAHRQELPGSHLGILEGQAYIVGGYLATLAALLILSGALADHYGRRSVYPTRLGGVGFTS